jgi:hypothetical protein
MVKIVLFFLPKLAIEQKLFERNRLGSDYFANLAWREKGAAIWAVWIIFLVHKAAL